MQRNDLGYLGLVVPRTRPRSLVLVMATSLLVLAVLLFASSQSDHPLLYILVGSLFLVTLVPYLRARASGPVDLFEPIYPVAFLYFLYFGLHTLYVIQNPVRLGRLGYYSEGPLSMALVYTIIGFVFLLIGYYSTWPDKLCRRLPSFRVRTSQQRIIAIVCTIYAIGLILRIILITKGWHIKYNVAEIVYDVPAGFYLIDYLTDLCTFSYMLAAIYYFAGIRNRGFALVLWTIMLPLEVVFAFLSGSKYSFLSIIFPSLIGYHYFKRYVSIYPLLVCIIVFVFAITPIITAYRMIDATELRSKGFFDGLVFSIRGTLSNLADLSSNDYLGYSYETFMERVNGSGAFSLVLEAVPERMDFQYGKTIGLVGVLLIPTVLWPGKYEFHQSILAWDDLIFSRRGLGGIAITQIGELYLNFHIVGIVVGMFLLGVFYRVVYRYFAAERNPVGLFLFINLWLSIIFIEFPFGAAYANLTKHLVILFTMAWLVSRNRLFGKSSQARSACPELSTNMEVVRR